MLPRISSLPKALPACQLRQLTRSKPHLSLSKIAKMGMVFQKAKKLSTEIDQKTRLDDSSIKIKYHGKMNPMSIVEPDLSLLDQNIRKHINSDHPLLNSVSQYYFNLSGKRMRPVVIFLIARAISHHINQPTSDGNSNGAVNWKQNQLAQIIEMIHTASLVHDDIIDEALTRRQQPSINVAFGNKVSVLVGDFLLARASICLSELQNFEVTALMSRVISDLVEGEFMQMKTTDNVATNFEAYIQKTYYKTASLFTHGCKASVLLGDVLAPPALVEVASQYGHHFGLAFQLIDDILDFVGTQEQLGKPVGNDMKSGVITAPVLFATEEFPALFPLMERGFSHEGDFEQAWDMVHRSQGIQKAKELATSHIKKAILQLDQLNDSPAKLALCEIAQLVLNRTN